MRGAHPYHVHALTRIRTETPYGTTPSRWRVYQFHHQGDCIVIDFGASPTLHQHFTNTSPTFHQVSCCDGSDGTRTRDLSSDSRVL